MEIIINQSVDVKRTVNRSTIYLLTKILKKPKIRLWWPNQQKFHNSHSRLRPQVLAQRVQFYCKLPQRLQEMEIVQNQQELRSYLTMEVRDLM